LEEQLLGHRSPDLIVLMEMMSAEYGWTPSQIRQESEEDMLNYLEIINTRRFIENKQNKRNG